MFDQICPEEQTRSSSKAAASGTRERQFDEARDKHTMPTTAEIWGKAMIAQKATIHLSQLWGEGIAPFMLCASFRDSGTMRNMLYVTGTLLLLHFDEELKKS